MRKVQPDYVFLQFAKTLLKIISLLSFVEEAGKAEVDYFNLDGAYSKKEIKSLLAEQCFLFAAVAFENFLHELFVCYLNLDSTKYQGALRDRFQKSLEDKLGSALAQRASLHLPMHMTKSEISSSLDPKMRNLTFESSSDLVLRSRELLAPRFALLFAALTHEERANVDAWFRVRNHLAHRSDGSYNDMKKHLSATALDPAVRWSVRSKRDLGAYFMSRTDSGDYRLIVFLEALRQIGKKLTAVTIK